MTTPNPTPAPPVDQHYEVVTLPDPAALARAAQADQDATQQQQAQQEGQQQVQQQTQEATPEQLAALQAERDQLLAERNQYGQQLGQVQQQQVSQQVQQQLDTETAQYAAQLRQQQVPENAIGGILNTFRDSRYATMMAGPWAMREAQELATLSAETGVSIDELSRFRDPGDRRQFAYQAQQQSLQNDATNARVEALERELAELRKPSGQTFESGANGNVPRPNANYGDQLSHITAFANGDTRQAPASVLNEVAALGVDIPGWPRGT